MRRLTYFVVILAAIYAGYWFVGARAVENGAQTAISDLSLQGWHTADTRADTRGFPSRFDTTFSDVDITTPDGALRYRTDFIQAFALSYRPNRVIVAFAPEQTFEFSGLTVTLASDALRASAAVAANTDLSFDNFTAEAASIDITTDFGIGGSIGQMLLAMRHAGPAVNTYDFYLRLPDVILPSVTETPALIDALILDATARLDQPLDRHTATPAIAEFTLNDLSLDWAGSTLRGSGVLTPDANGLAVGDIVLVVTDHAALLDQLSLTGAIDPGVVPTWRNMADAMASGQDVLTLPITFANGQVRMGLFNFGPAPRLR